MNQQEKMKLGRRKAYLNKCVEAARLLEKYESDTSIRRRVFDKNIYPVIRVSYQAFNSMLNEKSPEKELEEINKKLAQ